jgi:hypothetical protein
VKGVDLAGTASEFSFYLEDVFPKNGKRFPLYVEIKGVIFPIGKELFCLFHGDSQREHS